MTTYFTEDHEWIKVEGDTGTIGITKFAAGQLGDVVYVELPVTGRSVSKGDDFAVVESVKAASDVYSPVTGTVEEANDVLADKPETVNEDPEGKGWFVRIAIREKGQLEGLMDLAAYEKFCEGL